MTEGLGAGEVTVIGAAFVGAVLGVINLFLALDQRRLKIQLGTGHAIPTPNMPAAYQSVNCYLSVTNKSAFPIFVSGIGLVRAHWYDFFWRKKTNQIMNPLIGDGVLLPIELKPRESVSIFLQLYETKRDYHAIFAETACGHKTRVTSPGFRKIVKKNLA